MIIILAIIGFVAVITLVIYVPYRQQIHRWFQEKKYKQNTFLVIAVVIVLVAAVATGYFLITRNKSPDSGLATPPVSEGTVESQPSLDFGTDLPVVELPNTDGETVKLSEHQDGLVILSFWSTLCKYCAQQLPVFQQLVDETEGEATIYLINIREPISLVQEYEKENDLDFEILVDSGGTVADLFQVRGTPTNIIVKDGIICGKIPGAVSVETLVGALEECKVAVPD